jgi:hypothetical protein
VQPEAFLFQRAHHAFGIPITFGGVVAGECLVNSQGTTGLRERQRGGLTAITTGLILREYYTVPTEPNCRCAL